MKLEELGWNSYFEDEFKKTNGGNQFIPVRVSREDRQRYTVISEKGILSATVSGSFGFNTDSIADYPAVGDWVVANAIWDESKAIIHKVLPRKTAFTRKSAGATTDEQVIAANIDIVFLVIGLNNDFNLRKIERYLTQISLSGAETVILLNKSDLCADPSIYLKQVESVCGNVPVHCLSATIDGEITIGQQYLKTGKTAAFVGSSGTGKSTIINRLLGEDRLRTSNISDAVSKGMHTTTWRELIVLPTNGIVIDSPGMRELQLWAESEEVSNNFEDIEQIITRCAFRNCTHGNEPRCAVTEAIEEGKLDQGRFNNYRKMNIETKYLERRKSIKAKQEQKSRSKAIAMYSRKLKKEKF